MGKYDEYKRQWYFRKKQRNKRVCSCGKDFFSKGNKCGSCAAKERSKKFPPPSQKGKRRSYMDGEKNPNYKDGSYKVTFALRNCPEYKTWRSNIFKQDSYVCQKCFKSGGKLQADHFPKLFSELLREFKIKTYEEGRDCTELWKAKGQTLCIKCHRLKDRIFYGNQHTNN